jgi:regulator of sirC expression with transglutaminase-like and TPR domain
MWTGRLQEALADCERALELRPGWPYGIYARGCIRLQANDAAGALEDLERAYETNPEFPNIRLGIESARTRLARQRGRD